MSVKNGLPEVYARIAAEVEPLVGPELAVKVAESLAGLYAGQQVWFPPRHVLDRARRDQAIRDGFDGGNVAALARLHNLSTGQIRRIIKHKQ